MSRVVDGPRGGVRFGVLLRVRAAVGRAGSYMRFVIWFGGGIGCLHEGRGTYLAE